MMPEEGPRCPFCRCLPRVSLSCSHPSVVCRSMVTFAVSVLHCVLHRRAATSVLAIPAMPIEEDQMALHRAVWPFLPQPVQALDGSPCSTLALGIKLLNAKDRRRNEVPF